MKMDEFRGKSADELKSLIAERKKEMLNLRFRRAAGELENASRFSILRKEIARAMTELSNQRNGNPAPAPKKAAANSKKDSAEKKPVAKKTTKKAA